MKAIVQKGYGSVEVLSLQDVAMPVVGDDEILVRVRAASVNVLDWRKMRAAPFVVRMTDGFRTPKQPVLGVDAAGVVETVGKDVTKVNPGDEVFGIGRGSFAEHTVGRTFASKPTNLSFEEAAAVPVAGSTALQSVRDIGKVRSGQSVLINGAGGGVAHLIVQIAKAFGAEVTATTTTDKLDFVRSIGADRIVDYTTEDFRASGERYDVIFEVGGKLTMRACRRSLTPDGRLVLVGAGSGLGGPIGRFISASFRAKVFRQPVIAFVSWESVDDLLTLKHMIEAGSTRPAVDRAYSVVDTPKAVRYVEGGGVRGKVVITV